jgi:hypothetical protein
MTAVASARQQPARRPAQGWPTALLRAAGAGLLIATAAIHLDLYLTGYRTIPTIGWLFLLQVIAAFGLGLAVLAVPGRFRLAGLWVPKTCATWPDAPLTAGCPAPRLPGRGMIFGLWA